MLVAGDGVRVGLETQAQRYVECRCARELGDFIDTLIGVTLCKAAHAECGGDASGVIEDGGSDGDQIIECVLVADCVTTTADGCDSILYESPVGDGSLGQRCERF